MSCVEQGRWHYVSRKFSAGDKAFLKLRRELHQQVTSQRRETGMPMSDQSGVWRSVGDELRAADAASATGAMRDAYDRKRRSLADVEQRLPYVDGATGLVCAVQGRLAFAEIFDRPDACRRAWSRLVRSVAFETRRDPRAGPELSLETARGTLGSAAEATVEEYSSRGLGKDLRLSAESLTGSALAVNDRIIHCSLFSDGQS